MKLLLISDEESAYLWDHYQPGRLDGIDLILSGGDLKAEYLRFLVTMGHAPLLYVHGNHDGRYENDPPEGCESIEDRLIQFNGLRILGLGGCPLYSGEPHQYTEREMAKRIRRLRRSIRKAGGVDLIITHAPPRGMGDMDDSAHIGFQCFVDLIEEFKPKYFVHGHVHKSYAHSIPTVCRHGETLLINACGRLLLDTEHPPEAKAVI